MKFYHHINPTNKGGVTIAYEIVESNKGKSLVFSFAQCSKKDYYCKRIGRDRALDKYITDEVTSIVVKGSMNSIKNRITNLLPHLAATINQLQAN